MVNNKTFGEKVFISNFKKEYEQKNQLDQLRMLYNVSERAFSESIENGKKILKYLMNYFDKDGISSSELKTLLIISRPYKDCSELKSVRNLIYNRWDKL